MAGYRPEYCRDEQLFILNYIVEKESYYNLRGNKVWQEMEKDKIHPRRTWQSLKEHFRKKILPNLHSYGLSVDDYKAISHGYESTSKAAKVAEKLPFDINELTSSSSDGEEVKETEKPPFDINELTSSSSDGEEVKETISKPEVVS